VKRGKVARRSGAPSNFVSAATLPVRKPALSGPHGTKPHVVNANGGEDGVLIGFIGGGKSIGSVESYLEKVYPNK
jgi:hypothetical protein